METLEFRGEKNRICKKNHWLPVFDVCEGVYAEIGRWKDICRISCDPANTDLTFRLLCLNTKHGQYLLNRKENRGRRHLTSIKWCVSTYAGSGTSGWISVSHPSPPGGGNVPTLVGKCQKKNNSLNDTNSVTRVSCLLQLCIYCLQNRITFVWIFKNCWLKEKRTFWPSSWPLPLVQLNVIPSDLSLCFQLAKLYVASSKTCFVSSL